MKRIARVGTCLMLAAAGGLLAPACVPNESSLFMVGCLIPDLQTCEVTFDPASARLFESTIDTAFAGQYSCLMLVGNQLVARGDPNLLRTETSRIILHTAEVRILNAGGQQITRSNGSRAEFSTPITGEVDPGSGTLPGYSGTSIVLLDAASAADLGDEAASSGFQQVVVAEVILQGRTLGGLELESAPLQVPITVCRGCLCIEPTGDTCVDATEDPEPNCRLGLDNDVDCRFLNDDCANLI
jgi:hypothetical protein